MLRPSMHTICSFNLLNMITAFEKMMGIFVSNTGSDWLKKKSQICQKYSYSKNNNENVMYMNIYNIFYWSSNNDYWISAARNAPTTTAAIALATTNLSWMTLWSLWMGLCTGVVKQVWHNIFCGIRKKSERDGEVRTYINIYIYIYTK
jgi:hypothetical protein